MNSFDDGAMVYDLEPGQFVAWAQNAPHRVTNMDSLNVSLSTEHFTRQTRKRARVYSANRFFRTRLGLRNLSAREDGVAAAIKTVSYRVACKAGLNNAKTKSHTPTMRVDADAPLGAVPLYPISVATQAFI